MPPRRPAIAIVGAGFSGSLLALHLVKLVGPQVRISLIERGAAFARGLAYSAHNPRHVLNVRVGNMSAWPHDPDHLARWLAQDGGRTDRKDFISRGDYGRYLAFILQEAIGGDGAADRLLLEHDEVVAVTPTPGGLRLTMAMGRAFEADVVVLATGYLPPGRPNIPGFDALGPSQYVADPWSQRALVGLEPEAPVLLLGSGLTMVDAAVALDAAGHVGPVHVLSRRGLAPRSHGAVQTPPGRSTLELEAPLSGRLRRIRRRAAEVGWRTAVDEIRPFTRAIWRGASPSVRRRFVRHLRPWWDVHRHRMAPLVAQWFEAERARGRIVVSGGRIVSVAAGAAGVTVAWRPRGRSTEASLEVARIINCTGPGNDLAATTDPVLRSVIDRGLARPDELGLGLDVCVDGCLIDAGGYPDRRLYAVGPITRGAFWESVAVPDIRDQVADLAAVLSAQLSAQSRSGPGRPRNATMEGLAGWLQHAIAQDMVGRPDAWATFEADLRETYANGAQAFVEHGAARALGAADRTHAFMRKVAATIAYLEGARVIVESADPIGRRA